MAQTAKTSLMLQTRWVMRATIHLSAISQPVQVRAIRRLFLMCFLHRFLPEAYSTKIASARVGQ